jgi:hypothetical protein
MNPVAFAMTGLVFGLWLNALNLLGIASTPTSEGASPPAKSVAVGGSLTAAITLIIGAIWLFIGVPFGEGALSVQAMFSGIMGMYGLLWIAVFAMQWFGIDPRPVGNLCLLMAIMQIIHMIGYWSLTGMASIHNWIELIVLGTYVVLLYMFWKLLNGKMAAQPVGWWTMVTVVGTLYLLYFSGGIFPAP